MSRVRKKLSSGTFTLPLAVTQISFYNKHHEGGDHICGADHNGALSDVRQFFFLVFQKNRNLYDQSKNQI